MTDKKIDIKKLLVAAFADMSDAKIKELHRIMEREIAERQRPDEMRRVSAKHDQPKP